MPVPWMFLAGAALSAPFIIKAIKDITAEPDALSDEARKKAIDIQFGKGIDIKEIITGDSRRAIVNDNKMYENTIEKLIQDRPDLANQLLKKYIQDIDYMMYKSGVPVDLKEVKRENLYNIINTMNHYGISRNYGKLYLYNKIYSQDKPEVYYKNVAQVFDKTWEDLEKEQKLMSNIQSLSLAMSVGGMVVPWLTGVRYAPIILGSYLGDIGFTVTGIKEANNKLLIDKYHSLSELFLTLPIAGALVKRNTAIVEATKGDVKFFKEYIDDVINSSFERSRNLSKITVKKIADTSISASKRAVNGYADLGMSLSDFTDNIKNFNGLVSSVVYERDTAKAITEGLRLVDANKRSAIDIIFSPSEYRRAVQKAYQGQELSNIEEMAVQYANYSFDKKFANDISIIGTRSNAQGKVQIKYFNPYADTLQEQYKVVKEMPVTPKHYTNREAFDALKKQIKEEMVKVPDGQYAYAALEMRAGEEGKLIYMRTYEYPYTPFMQEGIVASFYDTKAKDTFSKFIPFFRIEDTLKEMQSNGCVLRSVYSSNPMLKTRVEQDLKNIFSIPSEKVEEILAGGEEALRSFFDDTVRMVSSIRGYDVIKRQPHLLEQQMKMLSESGMLTKEMQEQLIVRSVGRNQLLPYNFYLRQYNVLLESLAKAHPNSLAAHMKRTLDMLYDPNFYKQPEINKVIRSSWVTGNVSLALINHIQALFVGSLKLSAEYGFKGINDFVKSYIKAFVQPDTYKAYAQNVREFMHRAPFKKNGWEIVRDSLYSLVPLGTLEERTVLNLIKKNPQYQKAFGFFVSDPKMASRMASQQLQFMGPLEMPFVELKHPATVDLLFSFYRYMSRPVATLLRTAMSKKGFVPALVGTGIWATAFGTRATPLHLPSFLYDAFARGMESEEMEKRPLEDKIVEFAKAYGEGLIPDSFIGPIVLTMGRTLEQDIMKGSGVVGKLLREQLGVTPSFTTLQFSPDVPHLSPIAEAIMKIANYMWKSNEIKKRYDTQPSAEAEREFVSVLKGITDTLGVVNRLQPRTYASGYGMEILSSPAEVVQRIMFPQRKYPVQERQRVPISLNNISYLSKMTGSTQESTEYLFKAIKQDKNAEKLFVANASNYVQNIIKNIDITLGSKKKAPEIRKEEFDTRVKALSMILAWHSALKDSDSSKEVKLISAVVSKYTSNVRPYLMYYYDVKDTANYYKNTIGEKNE